MLFFSLYMLTSENALILLSSQVSGGDDLLRFVPAFFSGVYAFLAFLTLHLFPFRSQHLLQFDCSGQ